MVRVPLSRNLSKTCASKILRLLCSQGFYFSKLQNYRYKILSNKNHHALRLRFVPLWKRVLIVPTRISGQSAMLLVGRRGTSAVFQRL